MTKQKRRYLRQLLTMLLVVSMLVCELPASFIYATEDDFPISTEEPLVEGVNDSLEALALNDSEEVSASEEPIIVAEVEEMRDEKTKYFEMSDGTIKACIYPQAVHYLADGVYKEIDNTLELVGTFTDTVSAQTEAPELDQVEISTEALESVLEEVTADATEEPVVAVTDEPKVTEEVVSETVTDFVGARTITDSVGAEVDVQIDAQIESDGKAIDETEDTEDTDPSDEDVQITEDVEEKLSVTDELVDEVAASSTLDTVDESSASNEDSLDVVDTLEGNTSTDKLSDEQVSKALETFKTPSAYYENKNNAFKVKLPVDYESGYTEFSDENGYVRFKLLGTTKGKAKKEENKELDNGKDKTVVKNVNSKTTYASLKQDIDLEYDVKGDQLKETIVLNKKTKQDFVFFIETSASRAQLNEDGSISFYGPEGNELYTFAAPYMVDDAGEYSNAVEVELTPKNNGYLLTYKPDEEWLYAKERVYPVRIDPTMFKAITKDAELVEDTYVYLDQTNASENMRGYVDIINVGRRTQTTDGEQLILRGMMRFDLPSEISDNDCIVDAKLYLTHYPYVDGYNVDGTIIDMHELSAPFYEDTTYWDNQPTYAAPIIDYAIVDTTQYFPDTEVSYDVFNFTELANKWHNGEENYGMLLKLHNESVAVDTSKQVYYLSKDSVYFGDVSKFVEITYRNTLGLESYFGYNTYDVGRAGTANVNLYNGNLVYTHGDVTNSTELNAFSIAHVFNGANALDTSARCGKGWRLNILQRIDPVTVPGNSAVKYVYTDADGTKHYLVETDGKIVDEDGLGYTYASNSETGMKHQLTTQDKTVLVFDEVGFLRIIRDANGNEIKMNVGSISSGVNYVKSVSTSSGDTMTLQYDTSNNYRLSSITDKAGRVTTYGYDSSNRLTTITYPDNTITAFTYKTTGHMSTVKEPGGTGYTFAYNGVGRVTNVYTKGTNITGNDDEYSYEYCQTKVEDSTGYATTYQFDTAGRVTGIYDSLGNICSQKYTDEETSSAGIFKNNKVEVEASGSVYVNNLLKNGSLASGTTNWTSVGGTAQVDTTKNLLTPKTIKITNTTSGNSVIRQTVSGLSSGTYTLSGYVQGSDITSSGNGGVGVQIVTTTQTITSELVQDPTDTVTDNGFTRVSATVTLADGESISRVEAGLINAAGTAYIDSLQLEEGEAAGPINLLENSSFEIEGSGTTPYGYSAGANVGNSGRMTSALHTGSYGLHFTGSAAYKRTYSQTIALSGSAGDAYTFGTWAKGYSVEKRDDNKPFALTLSFYSGTTLQAEETIELNTAVNDWQFASKTVLAEKAYDSVKLTFRYENNANGAHFDDAFLYRDTAMSYTYDSNGNVVSTEDYAEQNSNFQYTGNNLSKVLDATGTGFEYMYNSKNNLIGAKSSEGNQYVINSYSNGNPYRVRTMTSAHSAAIQANETYYIRLMGSGKYLTADSSSDGSSVSQATFTGATNQQWKLEQTIDGYYYLVPANAISIRLDVAYGTDADGTNILVCSKNTGDNQKFQIKPQGNYTYTIVPKSSTAGRKVAVASYETQDLVTLQSSGGDEVYWYFENVEETPPTSVIDGTVYRIRASHSGRFLDVPNSSTTVGTGLIQCQINQGKNQQFLFTKYEETEYYTITPMCATSRLLAVSETVSDTGYYYLSIGDSTITDKKLFKLEYNSDYLGFRIMPKSNEATSVNLADAFLEDGGDVIFYVNEDTANSHFVLEECSKEMESTISYTSDGNYVSKTTDERGYATSYSYDDTKDLLLSTTNARGTTTSYTYNGSNDRLLSVTSSYSTEAPSTVSYTYNTDGSLNTITSPSNTTYSFTYDSFGRRLATKVGSRTLGSYTYVNDYSSLVKQFDYGNGSYKNYTYDSSDRLLTESVDGKQTKGYIYDKLGNIAKEEYYQNGSLSNTISYRYDLSGRLTGLTDTLGRKLNYVYDKYNRVTHQYYNTGANDVTTAYDYGDNASSSDEKTGLLYGVFYDGKYTFQYGYDSLNRLAQKTYWTGSAAHAMYTYMDGPGTNKTTTIVDGLLLYNKTSAEATSGSWTRYNYTYDELGNIKTIKKNGVLQQSYEYDSKNQLLAVDDKENEAFRVYSYDLGGNIEFVNEYKNGSTSTIKTYDYTDSEWGDLLTEYNGESIIYDAIGNPTHYRDGMKLSWMNGRQLFYVDDIITNTRYTYYEYNADGYRSEKEVLGEPTIKYTYIDGVLMSEKSSEREMIYLYDENGLIAGLRLIEDGVETTYYYQTNIQGDVIGILNEAGVQVAAYRYDEWGKVLSVTGSDAEGIGQLNPIRYRGYYYDWETGFYYLNSRYYDPEVGRFLNADEIVSGIGESIQGYNQFSYCGNNPVNMIDSSGNWPKWVKDAAKWMYENVVDPLVTIAEIVLSEKDETHSVGVNINASPSLFNFSFQGGLSADTDGNIALQGTYSVNVAPTDQPGASASIYRTVTNAPTIYHLNGTGYNIGGSVSVPIYNVPVSIAADFNILRDLQNNKTYFGNTTAVGLYAGSPGAEIHVGWGETATLEPSVINLFELHDFIYANVMEW